MRSRYSFFGDCQVETSPGHWIPAKAYYYKEMQK
jgi:hypothetical protein